MGTTYHLKTAANGGSDANNGLTSAAAKLTWTAGCALLAAGDTLRVGSGSYQGSIYINSSFAANGTSASPITVLSTVKYGALILPISPTAAGSGNYAGFEVRRDSWVIDGLEINGSQGYSGNTWIAGGTEWYIGAYLTGTNVKMQNCKVHDIGKSVSAAAQGGAGIETDTFYGGSAQIVNLNWVYNVGSTAVQGGTVHGIYVASNNVNANGNLVHNCNSVGIHAWHTSYQDYFASNTIFRCNFGILVGASAGTNHDSRVFNNIVYDCLNSGIVEQGSIGTGNLYSNNNVTGSPTNWSLTNSTHTSDVAGNPSFINYISSGGGNYHLQSASPCINIGLASLSGASALLIDLDGNTRPVGAQQDLGAYELQIGGGATSPTSVTVGRLHPRKRHRTHYSR